MATNENESHRLMILLKIKRKKNPNKIFVLVWILESLNHRSTWIIFMARGVGQNWLLPFSGKINSILPHFPN